MSEIEEWTSSASMAEDEDLMSEKAENVQRFLELSAVTAGAAGWWVWCLHI